MKASEPITEKNFADLVDDLFPDNRTSKDGKYRDITEAAKLFDLAKNMAFEYHKFATDYHRIESQNVRHYCNKHFNGGMISWIGADDNKIFEAYLKGEQLEAEWLKELKEKNGNQ